MTLPRQVGRYRLSRRIGLGAWGPLFRARVPAEGGGWREAVVELPSLRRGPGSSDLTRHAAAAVGRLPELRSEHLVRVRALERADDTATGSKELVVFSPFPGVPLHRVIRHAAAQGIQIPLSAIFLVLQQAARALQFLAAQDPIVPGSPRGMVHGTLRPAALFVDARGRVRVLEAGLRHVLGRPAWSPGGRGAPAFDGVYYLSPEEAAQRPADSRSDIYSLGLVAFELITGRPLIERIPGEDLEATLGRVLTTPLDRRFLTEELTDHDGHGATPAQAAEVVEILASMLAEDPERRCDANQVVGGIDLLCRYWPPALGRLFFTRLLADYDPEDSGERSTEDEPPPLVLPPRARHIPLAPTPPQAPDPDASQELDGAVPAVFEQLPVAAPVERPSTLPSLRSVQEYLPEIIGPTVPRRRRKGTEAEEAAPPEPRRREAPRVTARTVWLTLLLLAVGWVAVRGVPDGAVDLWNRALVRFAPQFAPQPEFVPAAAEHRPVSRRMLRYMSSREDGVPVDPWGNPWTVKDGDIIGQSQRLRRRLDEPGLSAEERARIEDLLGRPSDDIPLAHRAPSLATLNRELVFEAWLGKDAPSCRPQLVSAPLHGEYRPIVMFEKEERWRAVVTFPDTPAYRNGIVYYLECCTPSGDCPLQWKSADEPHVLGTRSG